MFGRGHLSLFIRKFRQAFGAKAFNLTAETVFLPSRWLHLWTIPDEWAPSSAFEKETSAGKSALNFFMLTIYAMTTKRRRCVDHQATGSVDHQATEMRGPPSGGVPWTTKRRRCVDHQATEMRGPPSDGDEYVLLLFFNVLTRIAITNSLT